MRISQVVTNLIDNATKFSPAGSAVHVRLCEEAGHVRCEVADEGIGIPHDQQAQIFERFVQLNGGDTRSAGGAGLGLAIAKGIVEAHGGRIGVESQPGHGSTFFFILPLAAAGG
jgi:signal transduction histidine kinase